MDQILWASLFPNPPLMQLCCFSHSTSNQVSSIGCRPGKLLHDDSQSRLWCAEQRKEKIRSLLAEYPPPQPPQGMEEKTNVLVLQSKTNQQNSTQQSARTTKKTDGQGVSRDAFTCLGASQVSLRLVPVQDSFATSTITGQIGVASRVLRC